MSADPSSWADPQPLFDNAPCGLLVTQEDGSLLRVNQTFCQLLGFSQAELLGRRFQDLLSMGGRIFHQTHWAPLMHIQGSVAEVKLELLHRDGHGLSMLLNGVRREHAHGVVHELAVFAMADRDKYERELIHSRKLAEDLLRENNAAEAALKQAQAELSLAYEKSQRRAQFAEQMVAIVSHDLKNPLTAITMASDMLARGERSAKEALLIGHISQSSERARRMIADLLDLALARVGRGIGIAPVELDLHQATAHCLDELRVAFPRAHLQHQCNGSGHARLDADRLQQVIGNLVANSVAYGDLQRPISITSTLTAQHAVVSVHNEGPAIASDLQATLFEPMTRGTEADNDVRSVGLGLFIVREIAQAHGGDVSVSSSANEGTTFSVSFPIQA